MGGAVANKQGLSCGNAAVAAVAADGGAGGASAACGKPRVVVIGLASCFGCQLQITNAEASLLDILGQIDVRYWQLTSSGEMPQDFDVAVVEGAVTTVESQDLLRRVREQADVVIAVGACAVTAGIPGMAAAGFSGRAEEVYAQVGVPSACGDMLSPRPVSSVIDVDYEVRSCPIDTMDFVDVLQGALRGTNKSRGTSTMCGDCKRNETGCFFGQGKLCLGLVTMAGCGARCVNLGRPCNGCRGLSPDANLASAREACRRYGVSVADFDRALELFNQLDSALQGER